MIYSLNKCSFIENYYFVYRASILRYLLLAIKAKGASITSLTLTTPLIATFITTPFNFRSINRYIPFLFEDRFLAAFSSAIACFLATIIALFSTVILSCSSFLIFFCTSSSTFFATLLALSSAFFVAFSFFSYFIFATFAASKSRAYCIILGLNSLTCLVFSPTKLSFFPCYLFFFSRAKEYISPSLIYLLISYYVVSLILALKRS